MGDSTEQSVKYAWRLLRAGRFRLDGGSMFGLVPRVVWSRTVAPDERGRIEVEHNCLMLERSETARQRDSETEAAHGSPQSRTSRGTLLIEVGTGNKLDAKSRDIFAMGERWIGDALAEAGRRVEDVSDVIVSHLHFDHAGALTRRAKEGEAPEWEGPASAFAGSAGEAGVVRTFPNAMVHVQQREWADAMANRSVMTRTYFQDHLAVYAGAFNDRVNLVDSVRPFPVGLIPDRDSAPMGSALLRSTEVAPGVRVFLAPGHTWGQQAVMFTDAAGRTVVFTPDVMPTVNHVGAAYSLGYDVEPYTSMVTRRWLLEEAAAGDWLLVLDHEPGNPCQRVRADGKGWWRLEADEGAFREAVSGER
jgi:glyoxylase-like metal-dependent hydrolase (beta-lactamase superfamily II)